ncbi:MAG: thrombospondin type 3 repeat-containing protein [Patescibacteria group bacterium]|nr:thrombospondin type 3 repeat-containing protein [Patescibacteria group bacterium]
MATNPTEKSNQLERPADAATPAPEPVIHVIPDKFYGAALRKRVVDAPKAPPTVSPKSPTAPPKPPAPGGAKKKGSSAVIIALVVVLLLGGGGGAAYYFLYVKPKPATPPITNQPPTQPPKTVCGNGQCESGETTDNCSADCQAKTECGNGQCEAGETAENCAKDCQPKPTCGDGKCESPETYATCQADCPPPEPLPSKDSDSDGLTDIEETSIYGTNPNDPDTDHDSFVDVNEVLNLFNPLKPSPSMLADNPGIATYRNTVQNYELLYPSSWQKRVNGDQEQEAYFTAPTGEFIEVLVEANPENRQIIDWFLEKSPGVSSSQVQSLRTRNGYEEIIGPDRMTAFIATPGRIFVVSYNLGDQMEIRYKATFQMLIASLKVTGPAPVPVAPAPAEPPATEPTGQPAAGQ